MYEYMELAVKIAAVVGTIAGLLYAYFSIQLWKAEEEVLKRKYQKGSKK